MLELFEEEEVSGSIERKRPRGFQTCLTLTPHKSSDTSTIFTIVIFSVVPINWFTIRNSRLLGNFVTIGIGRF